MPHLFVHLPQGPVPYVLRSGDTVVGRGEAANIRIADSTLSRRHACVHLDGRGLFLSDLSSKNGTFVNGIVVREPRQMHDGDRVRFGAITAELIDVDDMLDMYVPEEHVFGGGTTTGEGDSPAGSSSDSQDLGPYEALGRLGSGSTSVVHAVRHRETGERRALKLLTVRSTAGARRLLSEARLQGAIDSDNVVRVYETLQVEGRLAVVLEWVDGGTLRALLDRGRVPLDRVQSLGTGLLAGLAAVHAAGIVHRDLKPANVLMTVAGCPKLADFGLARLALRDEGVSFATETGIGLGTPGYMAPEAYRAAAHVDERADVFGVGTVLYELVTGRPPFQGVSVADAARRSAGGDFVEPRVLRPDLSMGAEAALLGALTADVNERIATVAELAELWGSASV